MRSPLLLLALVAVAGCRPVPTAGPAAPAATQMSARAAPGARPAPASAVHPDRVMAREVLTTMRDFTDQACECADAACVSDVQARMGDWARPRLARIQM